MQRERIYAKEDSIIRNPPAESADVKKALAEQRKEFEEVFDSAQGYLKHIVKKNEKHAHIKSVENIGNEILAYFRDYLRG